MMISPNELPDVTDKPVKEKVTVAGVEVWLEYKKGDRKLDDSLVSYPGSGWEMYADYGYIPGTVSSDREALDAFIGPHPVSLAIFLAFLYKEEKFILCGNEELGFSQMTPVVDEPKVLLGFEDEKEAIDFLFLQYGTSRVFTVIKTSIQDLQQDINLTMQQALKEANFERESLASGTTTSGNEGKVISSYGQGENNPQLIVEL